MEWSWWQWFTLGYGVVATIAFVVVNYCNISDNLRDREKPITPGDVSRAAILGLIWPLLLAFAIFVGAAEAQD